jgi:hypothetical protein
MEQYKAYLIGPDGQIASRVDLVCENEEAAREQAERFAQFCMVELWQRARKIAVFQPPD